MASKEHNVVYHLTKENLALNKLDVSCKSYIDWTLTGG